MDQSGTADFNLKRIQEKFRISQRDIEYLPIKEEELKKIYDHYQNWMPTLTKYKAEILDWLNGELQGNVHSIRGREKDSDHLIEKIIRNVRSKPAKYGNINVRNYYKIITDLLGFRVIILDKRDWSEIHDSLLNIFLNKPERYVETPKDIVINYDKYPVKSDDQKHRRQTSYHAEKPNVYITSSDDRKLYEHPYLKIDNSKTQYRSIHYIIRYAEVYFEIQVRTIFEEGWLEFDHRITYPYDMGNEKKRKYIRMLNSLAMTADQLIAFYEEGDFEMDIAQEKTENTKTTDKAVKSMGDMKNSKKDFETVLVKEF